MVLTDKQQEKKILEGYVVVHDDGDDERRKVKVELEQLELKKKRTRNEKQAQKRREKRHKSLHVTNIGNSNLFFL